MAKIAPFENHTEEYDNWFDNNPVKYQAELNALISVMPHSSNGLEIGIGSGKFAKPLGIHMGVDPSVKMAKKSKSLGLSVVLGVAEKLPFISKSFDFVLMVTTLCFVDDINKTFQESYRVTKQNGFIILGFIDKESELGKIYRQNQEKSRFYNIATFFSTQEILEHLTQAGFHKFQIKQTIFPGKNQTLKIENGFGCGSFVVIKAQKI